LGFLCFVDKKRDKPQLPTEKDLVALRSNKKVEAIIKL